MSETTIPAGHARVFAKGGRLEAAQKLLDDEYKKVGGFRNPDQPLSCIAETANNISFPPIAQKHHASIKSEKGFKDTKGKPRMDLLPPRPLTEVARVYTDGANRIAPRNWEKGIAYGDCLAAALRHILEYQDGNDVSEHGFHPLAHAIFWLNAVLHYDLNPEKYKGMKLDNRSGKEE